MGALVAAHFVMILLAGVALLAGLTAAAAVLPPTTHRERDWSAIRISCC